MTSFIDSMKSPHDSRLNYREFRLGRSHIKEKYGRYLADIFQTGQTVTVQSKLITAGLAVEYHGEKR